MLEYKIHMCRLYSSWKFHGEIIQTVTKYNNSDMKDIDYNQKWSWSKIIRRHSTSGAFSMHWSISFRVN